MVVTPLPFPATLNPSLKCFGLHEAYATFLSFLKQRDLPSIKRAAFKNVVAPLIREQFSVALRNDLPGLDGSGVRGWKNVRLVQSAPTLN
jgi:hypothetical protein